MKEEKKELKISLSTVLLLISLSIIIIMGIHIYKTNENIKTNEFIADTSIPNPELLFDEQIPLIDYNIKYLEGSIAGVECKKIDYTTYSELLIEYGFIKENSSTEKSDSEYNFYRYYDNKQKYIVDLKVNANNYIEEISIMTDDIHQGN